MSTKLFKTKLACLALSSVAVLIPIIARLPILLSGELCLQDLIIGVTAFHLSFFESYRKYSSELSSGYSASLEHNLYCLTGKFTHPATSQASHQRSWQCDLVPLSWKWFAKMFWMGVLFFYAIIFIEPFGPMRFNVLEFAFVAYFSFVLARFCAQRMIVEMLKLRIFEFERCVRRLFDPRDPANSHLYSAEQLLFYKYRLDESGLDPKLFP